MTSLFKIRQLKTKDFDFINKLFFILSMRYICGHEYYHIYYLKNKNK